MAIKKKQRKVTVIQVKALADKLLALEYQRRQSMNQTIPLRATLKKFILQNGVALERYSRGKHPGSVILQFALSKIKRGYFYDLTLCNLHELAHTLLNVRWET